MAAPTNTTDVERVVATLALDHNVLPASTARQLIESSADDKELLAKLIAEVPETRLLAAVAVELKVRFIDLYAPDLGLHVDEDVLRKCDLDVLKRHSALPMVDENGAVVVAVANPSDIDLRQYMVTRFPQVTMALVGREQVQARLALTNSDMTPDVAEPADAEVQPKKTTDAANPPVPRSPLVAWVDQILDTAVAQGTSDIHFEMNQDGTMLARCRIDGLLRQVPAVLNGREMEVFGILMNRAGMDSANYLQPQDGKFSFVSSGRNIDVRVAMSPTVNGPKMVMRLLDSANVRRRLADMGFSPQHLDTLRGAARMHQGMVFVSGPTGSGKTTTLYALLREASSIERNVCTIEDPVEYRLPLVNQIQVRNSGQKKLTFADALRNLLRMDPDVILVGEVRDEETARTSLDAAITGHLVLSTVHARDAIGVYTRLIEIGAAPYMVAEAVTVSVAQRLIRRIHDCATPGPASDVEAAMYERLGLDVPDRILHPRGCEACGGSGYRGRVALVEVLVPSARMRGMVARGAEREELVNQARAEGFVTLAEHAAHLLGDGITSVEEAARILEGAD